MQFNIALMALAFFSAVEACKCGGNVDATRACCKSTGGTPSGDDCPANQISERLSNFASCCRNLGARSDCRCSIGCLKSERIAQGLKPLSDKEAQSLVDANEA